MSAGKKTETGVGVPGVHREDHFDTAAPVRTLVPSAAITVRRIPAGVRTISAPDSAISSATPPQAAPESLTETSWPIVAERARHADERSCAGPASHRDAAARISPSSVHRAN